jgi:hypothetical protein
MIIMKLFLTGLVVHTIGPVVSLLQGCYICTGRYTLVGNLVGIGTPARLTTP